MWPLLCRRAQEKLAAQQGELAGLRDREVSAQEYLNMAIAQVAAPTKYTCTCVLCEVTPLPTGGQGCGRERRFCKDCKLAAAILPGNSSLSLLT